MKIVVISDTHSNHESMKELPSGDILIHCGDFSSYGGYDETKSFLDWFSGQKHEHKIAIPGNHEISLCPLRRSTESIKELISSYCNIHFLIDQEIIIDNVKFYGTPWCGGESKIMKHWGFYIESGKKSVFGKIPSDTDILISHSPPFGILDNGLGSRSLLERVKDVRPVFHLFGHIHETYGEFCSDYTQFYNCSNCDSDNRITNEPRVLIL